MRNSKSPLATCRGAFFATPPNSSALGLPVAERDSRAAPDAALPAGPSAWMWQGPREREVPRVGDRVVDVHPVSLERDRLRAHPLEPVIVGRHAVAASPGAHLPADTLLLLAP